MDTTDKQNPQSAEERFREVPESSITHYLENGRRASGNLYLFFKEMSALQKEVAELRTEVNGRKIIGDNWKERATKAEAERQRLRDAVNERKRTYFNRIQRHHQSDGKWLLEIFAKGEDECEWFLSLLENPRTP